MASTKFKFFNLNEDVVSRLRKKTYPIWSDNPSDVDTIAESTLSTFYTASFDITASWDANYFWQVYAENPSSNMNAEPQFSISVGTTASLNLNTTDAETIYSNPSNTIYSQFANSLLDRETDYFANSLGENIGTAYIISVGRNRIKDRIVPESWQLNLSASSVITLVAKSGSSNNQNTYDIVSGSLSTGVQLSGSSNVYGIFYADRGVFVLDGQKLFNSGALANSPSSSFATSSISGFTGVYGYFPSASIKTFYNAISTGAYFKAMTEENVNSTHYFVRVKNYEFNSTENPTWTTGSANNIKTEFFEDPKTFITSVGFYDGDGDSGRCVAVAKLSKPILKAPDSEALIRVRLDF